MKRVGVDVGGTFTDLVARGGERTRRSRVCPGNLRGSHRDHGERRAGPHRRAWTRPPSLRAARDGWGGPDPCLVSRHEARYRARRLPAVRRRRLRPRAPAGAGPGGDGSRTSCPARLGPVRSDVPADRGRVPVGAGARRTRSRNRPHRPFRRPAVPGQDFEIVVELPAGPYTRASEGTIADAFRVADERAFSRVPPGIGTEGGQRPGRGAGGGRRQANRDDRR